MNALNNVKTRFKLTGGFLFFAFLLVALAGQSYYELKSINDGMTSLYLDRLLPIEQLGIANTEEAGKAAAKVGVSAGELVEAVDSVSAVIEENTAATEEMTANSTELTQQIESIASVSEENSAAVEQVSASTEEVSAQVEEVSASAASMMEMAKNLQQIVAQFKLNQD